MNAESAQNLITSALSDYSASGLLILASLVSVMVGLLVAYWGFRRLTQSLDIDSMSLEFMHSAEGTKAFKSMNGSDQARFAKRDQDLSRARIMAMDR